MMKIKFTKADGAVADGAARMQAAFGRIPDHPEAGFWPVARQDKTWSQSEKRAREIKAMARRFVVAGVGGSSLGARTLAALTPGAPMLFIDQAEPTAVEHLRERIGKDLQDMHWLWISKSGNTLEIMAVMQVVAGWYRAAGLKLENFSTVIAQPKQSPLRAWGEVLKVPCLDIPGNVSGRFSIFTPAGLVPAALAGVDLAELRNGVNSVGPGDENLARLGAACAASWARGEWVTLFWAYGESLRPFAYWFQQLWAESLAKTVDLKGRAAPRVSFPVPCAGSLDQHSLLQQVIEGARDKWVWILRVEDLEKSPPQIASSGIREFHWLEGKTLGQVYGAQAQGTLRALTEAGVSTLEWLWPRFDAYHLGQAMFGMEMLVAGLGDFLGIHSFNQPGVERGKTIALDILSKGT
jgi:glucose-6-phosphate isomerase